jgi:hypothetical protein
VTGLSTVSNYATASSNAVLIQNMVNSAGAAGGGTVLITNTGTYYVAQSVPSETNWAWANAAVNILYNNIEIAGQGTNNTILVGWNRATTLFSFSEAGQQPSPIRVQCTNFVLKDIALQARGNWAVSGVTNSTNIVPDTNYFVFGATNDQDGNFTNGPDVGLTLALYGLDQGHFSYNILLTNCAFIGGAWDQVESEYYLSNIFVQGCAFLWSSNLPFGNVGFFGYGSNFVFLNNTFNGNTNLAPTNFAAVSTNLYYSGAIAAVGLVWLQIDGNYFVGRNTILNNFFEGVQLQCGPNAVVGNIYSNMCSDGSSCALCATGWSTTPPFTQYSTCFIANSVYGSVNGQRGERNSTGPFTLNFSGNSLQLYPGFNEAGGYPGAAVEVNYANTVNVCGNTMLSGGHGLTFDDINGSALILNNDFGSASYCGIGYLYTGNSLNTAQIFSNVLGQGVNFHIQLPYTNSFGWFAASNMYWNITSNSVPLFTDPASSSIHIYQ